MDERITFWLSTDMRNDLNKIVAVRKTTDYPDMDEAKLIRIFLARGINQAKYDGQI